MKLYNLELHRKVNGKWQHYSTVLWAVPYPLAKGEKRKREACKAYFEFYKIVENAKKKKTGECAGKNHSNAH